MKRVNLLLLAASTAFLMSCGNGGETVDAGEEGTEATATTESTTYTVDTEKSTVEWTGKKLAYGHTGVIQIKDGEVSVENGTLKAGNFTIDMNTMDETTTASDEEKEQKLVGHLKSDDFFKVGQFPTSEFAITKVENGNISGNLTILDVTKEISFPAQVNVTDNELTANAEFTINRTDWGIKYASGNFFEDLAADKAISDDIAYKVNLVATK